MENDAALELVADEIASDPDQKLRRHIMGMKFMLEPRSPEEQGSAYVTCFCKDGDLLSQWRSYGSAGVALGFWRESLGSLPPPKPTLRNSKSGRAQVQLTKTDLGNRFHPRLIEVIYGDPWPEHVDQFAHTRGRGTTPSRRNERTWRRVARSR